jgi:hypothetical protein
MESSSGIQSLYNLMDAMVVELKSNPFCKEVTTGTLTEVDLEKMTIFPLAHIVLNNVTHNENVLSFNIDIFNLDKVDISKDLPTDKIYGNDNLMYIWTSQLYVVNRLVARLKQTTFHEDGWELDNVPVSQFINKEMENMLAGFQTQLTISIPNNINVC